jgi:hypothetical protein
LNQFLVHFKYKFPANVQNLAVPICDDIQLHSFMKRHGGLKRGDQLLSVNGVSVEGEPHEKAVELLKAAISSVKLVVRYL